MSRTAGALPPANADVTYFAAVRSPPIMPATCVPWPNGSPVTPGSSDTRLTRATTRDVERAVRRDARVDDRDADAAAGVPGRAAEAEQSRGVPCQTLVGARSPCW